MVRPSVERDAMGGGGFGVWRGWGRGVDSEEGEGGEGQGEREGERGLMRRDDCWMLCVLHM